jgi:hypothetical protein
MKQLEVGNVTFSTLESEVKLEKMGTDFWELQLSVAPGELGAWVGLLLKKKEQVALIPGDPLQNYKMVYLGVDGPLLTRVSRAFGAREVMGERYHGDVPMPHTIDVYGLAQPDGGLIALALNRADRFPETRAEAFFGELARSLRRTDISWPQ